MTSFENKKCGIYSIYNIVNKKIYIGQSIDIMKRWSFHKNALNNNRHTNSHLQRAWNIYGKDSFIFSIVELCDEFALNDKELFYIKKYNANNPMCGYNIKGGGDSINSLSDETKKKISESNKGKIMSEESRKKISETHQGTNFWNNKSHELVLGKNHWSRRNPDRYFEINNSHIQYIYCFEYNIVFDSINSASKYSGVDKSNIAKVVRGERKTAGKHNISGQPLHWCGVDDLSSCDYINNDTQEVSA